MERAVWVGLGGLIGTLGRYWVGGLVLRLKQGTAFPFETLAVNVLGCFLIGGLGALAETRGVLAGTTRAFLFIGVLGGFTTFSSFGYETLQLTRDGQWAVALGSVVLQVVVGLGAVWAGDALARMIGGA